MQNLTINQMYPWVKFIIESIQKIMNKKIKTHSKELSSHLFFFVVKQQEQKQMGIFQTLMIYLFFIAHGDLNKNHGKKSVWPDSRSRVGLRLGKGLIFLILIHKQPKQRTNLSTLWTRKSKIHTREELKKKS